jgi:hypothetical protein
MKILKRMIVCFVAVTMGVCAFSSTVSADMNTSYRKGDIEVDPA